MTDETIRHFYELVTMFHQLSEDFKKAKDMEEQKEVLDQCRFLMRSARRLIPTRPSRTSSRQNIMMIRTKPEAEPS